VSPEQGGFVPICSQNGSPDWQPIREQVERFAQRLARQFPQAFLNGNGTKTKKRVVSWMRATLPPHAGRPADEATTRAVEMRVKNAPWLEIYRECIPHFSELDDGTRQLAMIRLRSVVRSRRFARKRKKSHPNSQRQEICA
jgi:hypothetical protein